MTAAAPRYHRRVLVDASLDPIAPERPASYRPEVDGLRAIAVAVVIFYHAGFAGFGGGYVGVDVFFVISGYLITGLLVADLAAGRFSIRRFYERRARRIFPALFLVMLCCIPFAWACLTPGQLDKFFESMVAVALFVSNLYFRSNINYFGASTETLPLVHAWSLSVEEQFYVVYPLLLLIVWRWRRASLSWLLVSFALVSLAACLWLETREPTLNFFSAPTRAWELLLGALIALERDKLLASRWGGAAWREVWSVVGLALILWAVFLYDSGTPFPGRFAVPPVLGSALVLCFCSPGTYLGRVLASRAFVAVGLMSYSAYLWHQPIFAFALSASIGHPTKAVYVVLIALTAALSYLSWRYVERPFRQPARVSRTRVFRLSLAATVAFVSIGVTGHVFRGFSGRFDRTAIELAASSRPSPKRSACHSESYKSLNPGQACRYFEGETTWAVLGDSHGVELAYALAEELRPARQSLLHLTSSRCPPAFTFEADEVGCSRWLREAVAVLAKDGAIRNVVLVYRHGYYLFGGQLPTYPVPPTAAPPILRTRTPEAARAAYWSSFHELARALKAAGKVVYVVDPIPELGASIDRVIYSPGLLGLSAAELRSSTMSYYEQRNRAVLPMLQAPLLPPGTIRVRSSEAVCDSKRCFAIIGGRSMYFDDNHLSVEGARRLARLILGA